MIWDILAWIGGIVTILSTILILTLAASLIKELFLETYYDWKIDNLKKNYNYETKRLAVLHLYDLKKKYPELEITYNDEIIDGEE